MKRIKEGRILDYKNNLVKQNPLLIDAKYIKVIDDIPLKEVIEKNDWVDYKDMVWTKQNLQAKFKLFLSDNVASNFRKKQDKIWFNQDQFGQR